AILAGLDTVGAAALVGVTGTATAATAAALPARVFAPYFETWTGDSMSGLSQQSGAKHLTLAFLQTASVGSCTPLWSGDPGMPVASSTFGADISAIRSRGGDVVPSFGGFTADNTGTELADSCTSVSAIAAAFKKVITTYNVTRLDLDIEDNSLNRTDGIHR